MPSHPLEPLRCPSCSVIEGAVHKSSCAVYALPGDKRPIYFRPSQAAKDVIPYTPGERQAKAVIPGKQQALDAIDKAIAALVVARQAVENNS